MYDIVYLAPFGRNFITDLFQLIGSTRPKYLGRPKLEFASSCERFDVGSGLSLVLKARYLGTRKWPIPTRS